MNHTDRVALSLVAANASTKSAGEVVGATPMPSLGGFASSLGQGARNLVKNLNPFQIPSNFHSCTFSAIDGGPDGGRHRFPQGAGAPGLQNATGPNWVKRHMNNIAAGVRTQNNPYPGSRLVDTALDAAGQRFGAPSASAQPWAQPSLTQTQPAPQTVPAFGTPPVSAVQQIKTTPKQQAAGLLLGGGLGGSTQQAMWPGESLR